MIRPDLMVCWIKHNDYSLFRATLQKHRDFFGKIIIYFNENNRFPYLDHFMHSALEPLGNIEFLDQAEMEWGVQDWRDVATNEMLKHSESEWVASVEQDWFSRDWPKMFEETEKAMEQSDMCGWFNETAFPYIHPAYFFIKREVLDKTSKDFSPHPEIIGSDHFAFITKEVQEMGNKLIVLAGNTSPTIDADYFHLGGVNQNYLDFDDRLKAGTIHRKEAFYVYNYWSMKAPVVQSPVFMERMEYVHQTLKSHFEVNGIQIDPETSEWREFFK